MQHFSSCKQPLTSTICTVMAVITPRAPMCGYQIVDTNIIGVVAVTQAVVPHMAAQGSGKIINVSGNALHLPPDTACGLRARVCVCVYLQAASLQHTPVLAGLWLHHSCCGI